MPTSAVRGDPPGESAQNRTESVALSLTDTDLGGGNFVSQIFFNRSRDTFGGEVATQAELSGSGARPDRHAVRPVAEPQPQTRRETEL